MRSFHLASAEDTIAFGERVGRLVPGGTVLALNGDLGAGKTTFAKGVARGLGIEEEVTSPTFTVVSEYEGRLRLHHIDAYRLSGVEDFVSVGAEELLSDAGGICLIEWGDRIAEVLPADVLRIELSVRPDGARELRTSGGALEALLQ
ncbi:MAG TPA: tRNA (adenosine(37)-N6)-threonylcarbamoyltransferase complex ATPase subunit type 1 TsaE [Rectinemataceae bacterium]|nr:tRNA (adenosine(37)-N6)-threonylcarbamoyltransferase complex ATPase subunit type 1 TsaE [Rectinemataceae bacterium]